MRNSDLGCSMQKELLAKQILKRGKMCLRVENAEGKPSPTQSKNYEIVFRTEN